MLLNKWIRFASLGLCAALLPALAVAAPNRMTTPGKATTCLLYTSDAADE